jgi:hypothetical protein
VQNRGDEGLSPNGSLLPAALMTVSARSSLQRAEQFFAGTQAHHSMQ